MDQGPTVETEQSRRMTWFAGILVTVFVAVVYLPSLDLFLKGDDFIRLNQAYPAAQNLMLVFEAINRFFRPIGTFLFLVNHFVFDSSILAYNALTILIHVANVVLLYVLVFRLERRIPPALGVAFLFGTSPLFSEVPLWACGRDDSLVLLFLLSSLIVLSIGSVLGEVKRQIFMAGLLLGAIGSKENWIILPLVLAGFLFLVQGASLKRVLSQSLLSLLALVIYLMTLVVGSTSSSPLRYLPPSDIKAMLVKLTYLPCKYFGLGDFYRTDAWFIVLVLLGFGGGIWIMVVTRNRIAQWGLLWLLVSIIPTLPLYYAPSRYNYVSIAAFWIMVVALVDYGAQRLISAGFLPRNAVNAAIAIVIGCIVTYQSIMVQWEIKDYRVLGNYYRVVVEMYSRVSDAVPRDRPILFVNRGDREPVAELGETYRGYRKLLYTRPVGIWKIIDFAPLANFVGDPLEARVVRVPNDEVKQILAGSFSVLVFSDRGFFFDSELESAVREFYSTNRQLPPGVELFRFVPTPSET
ncbi:MAG: hypothetical protein GY906_12280 [bacterium]|nr:hypothetical protein [bacterium]